MDARTRWETEALREGPTTRPGPPKPAAKRRRTEPNWVTLKEAEEATGIPTNTLRKWVRKSDLPSYLESDGDLVLRMVDLDAIRQRARDLGREDQISDGSTAARDTADTTNAENQAGTDTPTAEQTSPTPEPSVDGNHRTGAAGPDAAWPDEHEKTVPEGTMLVPVDAWNKMLEQLGNLHEAGQQLAEARERAAKAETEATFLRERLAEVRNEQPSATDEAVDDIEPSVEAAEPTIDSDVEPGPGPSDTTSYWRYLTTGWRQRKRSGG